MSHEPLVSVIAPAHRAGANLPRAVRSSLAQIYASRQAIVAPDDGVDYLSVLERAGIYDDRLQQVSIGACSCDGNARNTALAVASGLRMRCRTHLLAQAQRSAFEVQDGRVAAPRGLFRRCMQSGRCASLEHLLDMTQNGQAPWLEPELEQLSEDPARAD